MSFTLLLGLNALAFIGMYLYFKNRIDRRLEAERLLDNLRTGAGRIVGEMIQDMNRITDRNITLIATKVEELRAILDSADRRILLMKKEVRKEEAADRLCENLKPQSPPPSPPADAEEKGRTPSEIFDLYRKGISPDIIANTLNLPASEVQLMIALRGRKGKS
ncbi:MAG: hypothetical protein LBT33_09610 [Spirochaetia bacterium]|nr:hypothetical protein [Spirochaetia bacterium]